MLRRALLLLGWLSAAAIQTGWATAAPSYREGEVLIGWTGSARLATLGPTAASSRALSPKKESAVQAKAGVATGIALVQLAPGADLKASIQRFQKLPGVRFAEPNYLIHINETPPTPPDDFYWGLQYGLFNTGKSGGVAGADINVQPAWSVTRGDHAVKVAVIDTGIDYLHEDLAPNIWVNPGEIEADGIDNDGNGLVDDVHGYDFVSHDFDPMDDNGHGTHVSGIIGAVGNNALGITGVSPVATLMAIKAFDAQGNGDVGTVIEAIEYARAKGARIINASWGVPEKSQALADEISKAQQAGILIVAAAGNEHISVIGYPAGYTNVIAVGALDDSNKRASFSNFGEQISLAAPGDSIYSAAPNQAYQYLSGTSMAAPHVAGVAALLLAAHPELTADQLRQILRDSTRWVDTDTAFGTGAIDAGQALQQVDTIPAVLQLNAPREFSGVMTWGVSVSEAHGQAYRLETGAGPNPKTWRIMQQGTLPASGSVFDWVADTSDWSDGTQTLRWRVANGNDPDHPVWSEDRSIVKVSNARILSPQGSDVVRWGGKVPVCITAYGTNVQWQLAVGEGVKPTTWSTNGLTLSQPVDQPFANQVVAQWNTADANPDQFYSLRLIVSRTINGATVRQTNIVNLVYVDRHLVPGWPVTLPVRGTISADEWRTVQAADLDGDGVQELVLVDGATEDDAPAQLLVYRFDGSLVWSRTLTVGRPYADIPVIGDLDGDGKPEIVVETGGWLDAYHADGTRVEGSWPLQVDPANLGRSIGDLTGSGTNVLVTFSNDSIYSKGAERRILSVYDHTGSRLARWSVDACNSTENVMKQVPALGHVSSLPGLDIVVPDGCSAIACFNLAKPDAPVWRTPTSGYFLGSPVLGDLDGDGQLEVVVGSVAQTPLNFGGIYVFDGRGKRKRGFPVQRDDSFTMPLALADLRGNRRLCVVGMGDNSKTIHAIEDDGFEAPGWPTIIFEKGSQRSGPVVADLDGDGVPEVLFRTLGFPSLAVSQSDSKYLGGINFFRADGQLWKAWGPAGPTASLFPEYITLLTYQKSSPPLVADLNGDGIMEIIAMSVQDRSAPLPGQEAVTKHRSSLYVWSVDKPSLAPSPVVWPGFGQNAQLTGRAPAASSLPAAPRDIARAITVEGESVLLTLPTAWGGASSFETPSHGSITPTNGSLAFVYTPSPGFYGTDTFRILPVSGSGQKWQLATLLVQALNQTPHGTNNVLTLNKNRSGDIFFQAEDREETKLTFQLLRAPDHGILFQYPSLANYQPYQDFFGDDTLVYQASDGRTASSPITVAIHVTNTNNPPRISNQSRTTLAGQPVTIPQTGSDVDSQHLSYALLTLPAHGRLIDDSDHWLYLPERGFVGSDGFNFQAYDGLDFSPTGRVDITITTNNTAPTAIDFRGSVSMDQPQLLNFQGTDDENTPLKFLILSQPFHGTISSVQDDWIYRPAPGYVGPDRFDFAAFDGALTSQVASATLQVRGTNHPPVISNLSLVVTNLATVPVPFSYSDADLDPVRVILLQGPQQGTLRQVSGNWVYVPDPNASGSDSFSYSPWDGHISGNPAYASIEFFFPGIPKDLRLDMVKWETSGLTLVLESSVPGEAALEISENLEDWTTVIDRIAVGQPFVVRPEAAYYRARWLPTAPLP